jgi:DNA-binding transcriptional MerR regulator
MTNRWADVIRIYEASRQIGVSERWLRNAEAKGVIPKARRDLNGWRYYTSEDIRLITLIVYPKTDDK